MAEFGNYLEDGVASQIRQQLDEHLSHCQSCHVILDSTRKTLKFVTDTESFDLPEAALRPITSEIMARIRETQK